MIIKPRIRGFICTTSHPTGCEANVCEQINYVKSCKNFKNGPKNVLIIGASTGYGLASRINVAFGYQASTIGVFFEKPGSKNKTGSPGWYNSASFDKIAKKEGLYAKSINCDAFSDVSRNFVIDLCKRDLGKFDLVIYSVASPRRKIPNTGKIVYSTLKPIGESYKSISLDTNKDILFNSIVKPATEQEVIDTVSVMGGQDWELWMDALYEADVLSNYAKTVAYSYIGTKITWPIYWHGTLGIAKKDLERAAYVINKKMRKKGGSAYIAVLKSVVTQSSSAIPVMPLYISIIFKIMKQKGIHESCIEQIERLFTTKLYNEIKFKTDEKNRLRLDDLELRDDVQNDCLKIWEKLNNNNINNLTDYLGYKTDFLRLFGFGIDGVDYNIDLSGEINFDVENIN
ncbi:Trans-2-enoyl-CoA reductase [Candidatus Providencia siddallii]|uniref:Enoyl-[acyl-carrier-protein] reductase [NADH] n=1 Tax=Candidatus Providencia siddallii TaxID=1715285 RepID=A0A0M6W9J1_9GAMM|nr:Trans-2-enoyl-CoA reductase [Candidatus Providencia siddallii]